jgi:tetratricopeptide (TPR) repeat protein
MPLDPTQPRRSPALRPIRPAVSKARVQVTAIPERSSARRYPLPGGASRSEGWSGWIALAAASLLLLGTVGWVPLMGLMLHGLADYHLYTGRESLRRGEPMIAVQQEWHRAIALDPGYAQVRLSLARSYIDGQWYGGAADQARAVLSRPRSRQEASLAYTYLGYCHYMLGEHAAGLAELALAVDYDAQNSLAQSVLERLGREGKLPPLN